MPVTFNEKLIAYLALLSGLAISAVAVYYSVVGLTAIFAAAALPIIIMGATLEISKLVATIWLKQNWNIAPRLIKFYLIVAIFVLMLITSMGIFGFLSKAHLDQTVPTGDVVAQIALIDEKIKVERDNIDVARKALKQLDDAVDQTMARSTTEQGAARSAQLRRNQARDRGQLQIDITKAQEAIKKLNEERAPLASNLRKVEAEVGPIKYIANFFYGDTEQAILEKAVTWVIITIIIVFDPLAVILLLASQTSFQNFRERKLNLENSVPLYVADVGEKPTEEEKAAIKAEGDSPHEPDVVNTATVTEPVPHHPDTHPYLRKGFVYPEGWKFVGPLVAKMDYEVPVNDVSTSTASTSTESLFIQNEEQNQSNLWSATVKSNITQKEYIEKAQSKQKGQNEK